jgi:hypothetical protein
MLALIISLVSACCGIADPAPSSRGNTRKEKYAE